jgi:hypothetical protein
MAGRTDEAVGLCVVGKLQCVPGVAGLIGPSPVEGPLRAKGTSAATMAVERWVEKAVDKKR